MMPFEEIALVDDHLHPPLLSSEDRPLATFFSEAGDDPGVRARTPQTLFYQRALRELSQVLHCPPDEASVSAARSALGPDRWLRTLITDANIETLLVDEGYPPRGTVTLNALAGAAGCRTERIVRIETLAESLVAQADSAKALGQSLVERLENGPKLVALKTIIAYRCGLAVSPAEPAEAEQCFRRIRAEAGPQPRLTSKPLLNYLLLQALDWAVERDLPVQFHTGYGDRDLDLLLANPAHLRPLLESPRFQRLKVVLLHASYPYSRAASYLAAVYPHVYLDWSEANPMLPAGELQRVLEELLALAPYSKLLYGSDAWGIPDWLWLGARAGRAALAAALASEPERAAIARRVLRENARELYRLA